eukprot:1738517-Amphidinium_carterae.1
MKKTVKKNKTNKKSRFGNVFLQFLPVWGVWGTDLVMNSGGIVEELLTGAINYGDYMSLSSLT